MSDMGDFICDVCGEEFMPGEDTFIGSADGSEECSPFTELRQLCRECFNPGESDGQD